jgi:formate hydrogenlyase subunit 3/multisubunit Na+/H+ antiporter MnhD subunit
MTLNGIPLHPLVVHAAVVFVPLAALAAVLFVVPRWRWAVRWPALVLSVVGLVVVQVAIMSGEDLERTRGPRSALIHEHQEYADELRLVMIVLVVLVALGFWAIGHTTRLRDREDRPARVAVLEKPLLVLIPIAGVAALVFVFLTGDAGARSVWGG